MSNKAKGLKSFKLDLHTHTPASKCYKDKSHTPEQIVQAAIAKGLDGIAITDHNTPEWIDKMNEAASGTDLTIFPGVEVSMADYHVVILFDPNTTTADVGNYLGSVDISADKYGDQTTICFKDLEKVVEEAHKRNGLVILAHIDSYKGIFFERSKNESGKIHVPQSLSQIINDMEYDAVECVKGELPWKINDLRFTRHPAYYQSPDNPDPETPIKHSLLGLGNAYSWFRMESPTIEGLRQCFQDPKIRIILSNQYKENSYPRIISLQIGTQPQGAPPEGYFGYRTFHFHESLNSIIGGRGVGKSTLIEFIRYVLDQPPYPQDIPPGDLDLHHHELYIEHNGKIQSLLRSDNPLELTYELESGDQYKITRIYTGNDDKANDNVYTNSTFTCIHVETGEEYTGDIESSFPILAYSQTEIVNIARHPDAQLRLIDQFVESQKKLRLSEINDILIDLNDNSRKLSESISAESELERITRDIGTIEARILEIRKLLDSDIFTQMNVAESKKSDLQNYINYVERLISLANTWIKSIEALHTPKPSDDHKEDEIVQSHQSSASNLRENVQMALNNITITLNEGLETMNRSLDEWIPSFRTIEKEYHSVLESEGGDHKNINRERTDLEERLRPLKIQEDMYTTRIQNLDELRNARIRLMEQLKNSHLAIYKLRKKKFDEISQKSDNQLRLTLEYATDVADYKERLNHLIRGGAYNISVSIRDQVADKIKPNQLIEIVLNKDNVTLANLAEITSLMAERVIERLWNTENFVDVLKLQYEYFPEDVPKIEYNKGTEAKPIYAPLNELSIGQKSTALVIIALSEGKMPIIIDQPEDALDISAIWHDIVKPLRKTKNDRQFILTTHNSTVAVGADSDQFIVLQSTSDRASVKEQGSIDIINVRGEIITHLEGGTESYKLKQKKYNIHNLKH